VQRAVMERMNYYLANCVAFDRLRKDNERELELLVETANNMNWSVVRWKMRLTPCTILSVLECERHYFTAIRPV
jgi:hypothetical protein